tara:strand:+ start:160 stop:1320 length:1161 start_codon:yes stop_codon:yes gene_type:complete
VVDLTPPQQGSLVQNEDLLLDIGISVFDPNVPEDYDEQVENLVMPEIRQAESQYFPYVSKNVLESTGNWGAVRVVPRTTLAVDVTVSGVIIESSGEKLVLDVRVVDARGVSWFEKRYDSLASKYSYQKNIPKGVDAFQTLYKEIADDMLAFREQLTESEIQTIRTVAELRFARSFSEEAFGDHIGLTDQDYFYIKRLPAEADPMLIRTRQIRQREYLFIDTIEDYYAAFHREMYPVYDTWRASTYADAIEIKELKSQAKARMIGGTVAIAASVGGIYSSENAYVDASGVAGVGGGAMMIVSGLKKKQEAAQLSERLLEIGDDAETKLVPTTIQLENETIRLEGSVEEQYEALRVLLRDLYYKELGIDEESLAAFEETTSSDYLGGN